MGEKILFDCGLTYLLAIGGSRGTGVISHARRIDLADGGQLEGIAIHTEANVEQISATSW